MDNRCGRTLHRSSAADPVGVGGGLDKPQEERDSNELPPTAPLVNIFGKKFSDQILIAAHHGLQRPFFRDQFSPHRPNLLCQRSIAEQFDPVFSQIFRRASRFKQKTQIKSTKSQINSKYQFQRLKTNGGSRQSFDISVCDLLLVICLLFRCCL